MKYLLAALLLAGGVAPLAAQARIGDLTTRPGDVPVRLVGYGLVVGLDGTGDRSLGGSRGARHTVQSVANLLRRFNVVVSPEHLRLRNVAAVMVTAEVSPYLRPGGRFAVAVSSLGDATSLEGGVLYITPLLSDPDAPPSATAQGPLLIGSRSTRGQRMARGAGSAQIPDGGVLEVELPAPAAPVAAQLLLRSPDLVTAQRITAAINAARGAGTAQVQDPGVVKLKAPTGAADNVQEFLASLDTLPVEAASHAAILIDGRSGLVVTGGDITVRPAVVSLGGITLRVGADSAGTAGGMVSVRSGATAQDVVAGLRAASATPDEIAAVLEALRAVGALRATVVVR